MLLVPGLERRRGIARLTARSVFARLGGATPSRRHRAAAFGTLRVVANHASYLDGLVLTAALPPRFAFVIKKEMDRVPLASLLLRRIGSEFVDRHDRHRGAMDARRMLRRASEGQALVFFPEGTFSNPPWAAALSHRRIRHRGARPLCRRARNDSWHAHGAGSQSDHPDPGTHRDRGPRDSHATARSPGSRGPSARPRAQPHAGSAGRTRPGWGAVAHARAQGGALTIRRCGGTGHPLRRVPARSGRASRP